jgi:hypothetical protein
MIPAERGRYALVIAFFGVAFSALPAYAGSAEQGIDPAALSFVPSPVISILGAHDEASCSRAGSISTGPHPATETVTVMVWNHACRITSASVTWTASGKAYVATMDPLTGKLGPIHPAAPLPGWENPSGSATPVGTKGTGSAPFCEWYYTSHTTLEMSWSGLERVKANYNWCLNSDGSTTTINHFTACEATWPWNEDACGTFTSGSGWELGRGSFHKSYWPSDYHNWDAADYVSRPDHRATTGECTPSGDLPSDYQEFCTNGSGNDA